MQSIWSFKIVYDLSWNFICRAQTQTSSLGGLGGGLSQSGASAGSSTTSYNNPGFGPGGFGPGGFGPGGFGPGGFAPGFQTSQSGANANAGSQTTGVVG